MCFFYFLFCFREFGSLGFCSILGFFYLSLCFFWVILVMLSRFDFFIFCEMEGGGLISYLVFFIVVIVFFRGFFRSKVF